MTLGWIGKASWYGLTHSTYNVGRLSIGLAFEPYGQLNWRTSLRFIGSPSFDPRNLLYCANTSTTMGLGWRIEPPCTVIGVS